MPSAASRSTRCVYHRNGTHLAGQPDPLRFQPRIFDLSEAMSPTFVGPNGEVFAPINGLVRGPCGSPAGAAFAHSAPRDWSATFISFAGGVAP